MNKGLSVFMNVMLSECCSNFARLFLRVFIGVLMLSHGIAKIENFDLMVDTFPDPLGMGRAISLTLILLAEVGCSILLVVGLMTRLAVLPLIFGMVIATFFTYPVITLSNIELPMLYLGIYITILMLGPGKCSIDYLLKRAYSVKLIEEGQAAKASREVKEETISGAAEPEN